MNKLFLIGNLTRDPELRETQNGIIMCNLSIAVQRDYLVGGERQKDFFNVTAWRKTAEYCAKYLKKGYKVALTASISNRKAQKQNVEYTVIEISVENVELLNSYGSKAIPEVTEDIEVGKEVNGTGNAINYDIDDSKLPF